MTMISTRSTDRRDKRQLPPGLHLERRVAESGRVSWAIIITKTGEVFDVRRTRAACVLLLANQEASVRCPSCLALIGEACSCPARAVLTAPRSVYG